MIGACREHSAKLRVYENAIFYPVYLKAKALIAEGMIGEPLAIRSHTVLGIQEGPEWPVLWGAPAAWRTSMDHAGLGPVVGDHGYHRLSVVSWFAERKIDTIGCWIDEKSPLDSPAFIRAKFKKKAGEAQKYAQIDFTFMPKMASSSEFWLDDLVEIVGGRGILWINQCDGAGDRDIY